MMIKIKRHGDVAMPEKHGNWFDLATAEDYEAKAGEPVRISLGVSMEVPSSFYGQLEPRSSTLAKWGIIGITGIIDSDYCGDNDIIKFSGYATKDVFIPKGTRLVQFAVKSEIFLEFFEVTEMKNPDRGGFGSTGD